MNTTGSALGVLEWVMNRALAADPEVHERLDELEGARIRIVSEPFPRPLDVAVRGHRLAVRIPEEAGRAEEEGADVTISGSPPALARLVAGLDAPDRLPAGVTISGDLALAQRLQRLARCYRFDWEEVLSRCFGDAGAHEVARQARAAGRFALGAADTLSRDVVEYLIEERSVVAGASRLERFFDAVDELRDDVDRLEVRIAALFRRTEEEP